MALPPTSWGNLGPGNAGTEALERNIQRGQESFGLGQQAQQQAFDQFAAMAAGNGPSVAEAQLQAGLGQSIAQQQALAAQGRGGNLAAQQRMASQAGSQMAMNANQQAAQLRAQEQQMAMQGMAGLGSDMANLGLQQELAYAGFQHDAMNQVFQGNMNYDLQRRQQDLQRRQQNIDLGMGIFKGVAGAVGSAVGGGVYSDERVKERVRPGNLTASQAVGEIEPITFEYKPGYGGPGERVGVSAQNLEQIPAAQNLVMDTPLGKQVDVGGLAALGVAASSDQEQRLRQLERALGLGQAAAAPQRFDPTYQIDEGSRAMARPQIVRAV